MCGFLEAAAVGGPLIELGAGAIGASAQRKQARENFQNTINFANENARQNYRQIGLRQLQEDQATAQSLLQLEREAQAGRATALASAGSSGVSGASIAALDRLYTRSLFENQQRVLQSRENNRLQLQTQADAIQSSTYASIVNATPNAPAGPNIFDLLNTGLNIGTGLYGIND